MKAVFVIVLFFLVVFAFLVSAAEFSGDGTHTVSKGDFITIDNGWKIEVLGSFIAHSGEQLVFRVYDSSGNPYPADPYTESFNMIEGRQKFGDGETLKVEIEILEVLGETTPTGSQLVTEYENIKINTISIDERLPGTVGGDDGGEVIEEVDKELTYKDGVKTTMVVGDEKELPNGYTLKFDSFGRFGPSFSIYEGDSLIDEGIQVGKDIGFFGGSYVHLDDFDDTSVSLNIIGGSKILFGTGWNLFSIPVEEGDGFGTVLESTCNEATIWRWDVDEEDYKSVGKLMEGTKIPANEGLWVKIKTKNNVISDHDCDIITSGDTSVTTRGQQLVAGWNLIGSPISSYGQRELFDGGSNFNFLNFDEVLGDCRIEKGPWQYLATDLVQVGQVGDFIDINKYTEPFRNNLRLGRGYFIKVIDDCTLGDK